MAEACEGNDAFWRECTSWLTRLGVLRYDHRATLESAVISDLANTLRDGAILCKLLHRLDPNCIDMKDVNLKPAMARFLCLQNIERFMKICEKNFGIREQDLFEPTMLFDLTNFHKVLCTLSKLSQSGKAVRHNILGFSSQNEKTSEDEEVYQSLKSVDLRSTPTNSVGEPSWLQFTIPGPRPEDREEEVYDDLCYVTFSACLPELPPLEKRDYVIKELVDTERNYVDVLHKLKTHFLQPLQSKMKPEVHGIIFYKINELYDIHSGFLSQLLLLSTDKSVKLSNIFMMWREKFLVYGEYCSKLSQACSKIQEVCESDQELNQLIIRFEKEDNNGKFKLRDVLSVPVQRILKYHLLLEKLTDSTDPNHEEFNDLKRAREAMVDVAAYINEVARDYEHREVIKNLKENMLCDNNSNFDLEDYGHLISDGEVKVKSHDDNKTRSRYVFIFDKCMLLCKQINKNAFQYRDSLTLFDYTVDDTHNRALLNQSGRWSYHWHLVRRGKVNCFTFSVRTIELKSKMIKAINDAKDNVNPSVKTSHKIEMTTFREPTTCNWCSKYLKGLIYQGYKCSTCHIALHKECLAQSGKCGAPLPTAPAVVTPPSPPVTVSTAPSTVGLDSAVGLSEELWYAGELDRINATLMLENRRNGTYLVRIRSQSDDQGRYALSLKTDGTVKHMKICCNINGSQKKYFLSLSKYFNSIEELIENYQHHSLKENFDRLEEHTRLELPYKLIRCQITKTYKATNTNELSLDEGQIILVIKKDGYIEDYWKGLNSLGIGYFPSNCVLEQEETTDDTITSN